MKRNPKRADTKRGGVEISHSIYTVVSGNLISGNGVSGLILTANSSRFAL
jgi:hypothetical protein